MNKTAQTFTRFGHNLRFVSLNGMVRVGADTSWTKEQKEAIARALAEMGQARTWNLMIDVIAQTGKCAPGETDRFIVQGEKRYWLHPPSRRLRRGRHRAGP